MPFFQFASPLIGGWRRHPRLSFPSAPASARSTHIPAWAYYYKDMELFLPHPRLDNFPPVSPLRSNPPHPRFNFLVLVPVRNWHFFGVTWAGGSKGNTSLLWLRASPQLVFQCVQKGFGDPNCPELLLFNGMLKKHMPYVCFYLVNGLKRRSNDAQTTLLHPYKNVMLNRCNNLAWISHSKRCISTNEAKTGSSQQSNLL